MNGWSLSTCFYLQLTFLICCFSPSSIQKCSRTFCVLPHKNWAHTLYHQTATSFLHGLARCWCTCRVAPQKLLVPSEIFQTAFRPPTSCLYPLLKSPIKLHLLTFSNSSSSSWFMVPTLHVPLVENNARLICVSPLGKRWGRAEGAGMLKRL